MKGSEPVQIHSIVHIRDEQCALGWNLAYLICLVFVQDHTIKKSQMKGKEQRTLT
jgi:hypothetical protein